MIIYIYITISTNIPTSDTLNLHFLGNISLFDGEVNWPFLPCSAKVPPVAAAVGGCDDGALTFREMSTAKIGV